MIAYYLFFIVIVFLCGRYNSKELSVLITKNTGFRLSVLFIILFAAFRFNIGYDWSSYLSFVYPYNPANSRRLEPFDRLLCYVFGRLKSPFFFFSFYAFVTYFFIGKTIEENSSDKFESLIIYLGLFYLISLSTIRQAIAESIVFYGFRYIKTRKLLKYLFICIVASLFHKTAIIALSFYFLYKMDYLLIIVSSVCLFVFVKFLLPVVLTKCFPSFLFYLNKSGIGNSSGKFQKLVFLLLYIYIVLLRPRGSENLGMLKICTLGVVLPFVLGGHTGGRLSEYFLIYYTLLIPECNKKIKISNRVLFLVPFYIYFFVYLYISVAVNHSNEYVPYRFYFLENLNQPLM